MRLHTAGSTSLDQPCSGGSSINAKATLQRGMTLDESALPLRAVHPPARVPDDDTQPATTSGTHHPPISPGARGLITSCHLPSGPEVNMNGRAAPLSLHSLLYAHPRALLALVAAAHSLAVCACLNLRPVEFTHVHELSPSLLTSSPSYASHRYSDHIYGPRLLADNFQPFNDAVF
jgi:hypothetical protein